ncbi:hypothetical protein Tco_0155733 [Tanacetum coccineum]
MEYLLKKFRHHHHRVEEMTFLDDERMKKRRNDVPCHDHFEVVEFVLGQEEALLAQQCRRFHCQDEDTFP